MGFVTWHPKDTNQAQNTENFFGERATQNTEANPIDNRTKQCKLLTYKLPIERCTFEIEPIYFASY